MPRNKQDKTVVPKVKHSIQERAAVQSVVIILCTIATLAACTYLIANVFFENRILAQLSTLVTAKKDYIENIVQGHRESTALLASPIHNINDANQSRSIYKTLQPQDSSVEGVAVMDVHGYTRSISGTINKRFIVQSEKTVTKPIVTLAGWEGFVVSTPVRDWAGNRIGVLAVQHSAKEVMPVINDASSLGETGEVILVTRGEDGIHLIGKNNPVDEDTNSPIHNVMLGKSDTHKTIGHLGNEVFASYHIIPSFGWGLIVQIDKEEAMYGMLFLLKSFALVGLLLLVFFAAASLILAEQLTKPLLHLSRKMQKLQPGHWTFRKTIKTGDEIEVLDHVAADLAGRLKKTYDRLEEEVADRTKKLKAEYAKDRTILQSVPQGVIVTDKEGIITDANPSALNLLKHREKSCIDKSAIENLDIYRHDVQLTGKVHPVKNCLSKRITISSNPESKFSIRLQNGEMIPLILSITPLLQGKKLLGCVLVFQDMTEERRVDIIKSEFIALASHQLRTPLSALQWYIELLEQDGLKSLTKEQRQYIKEMSKSSSRMVNLVDALLRTAHLEGGKFTPAKEEVVLNNLVRDMGEEMCKEAEGRKLRCTKHIPKENIIVNSDSVLLHIVCKNLATNAVKYTKSGGSVSIELKKSDGKAEIWVQDTGIGIPKDEQNRVFQKLFRANNVQKLDTDGNGLGLYISKMIIENLGGKITFQSKEDKGTVFVVSLPRKVSKKKRKKRA